ncbi:MAG: hypothetical protein JRJ42_08580 [Deltaproteobacteria bacterium]|nr:hypothetical protein [Deltaproteobacteria bacterium]MBW2020637.1 hypothetical protein [Deltaproteobacteria bacterium]
MAISAKLDDIIEGMEFQSDETTSYLHKKTGKVVTITAEGFRAAEDDEPIEDFPDWQHKNIRTAKKILEINDYLALPSKFDIHEYAIMERFCLSISDDRTREIMYRSIKGRGAFRRFKDNIHRYDIAEDWYGYRDQAIRQIAIDWCEVNEIVFS